jgi:hypothetical protein
MGKRACLLLWSAYVKVLSKQLRTVDKGGLVALGLALEMHQHRGVYCLVLGEDEITTTEIENTKYCYTGPPTWTTDVWVSASIVWLKTGSDDTVL